MHAVQPHLVGVVVQREAAPLAQGEVGGFHSPHQVPLAQTMAPVGILFHWKVLHTHVHTRLRGITQSVQQ